MLAIADFILGKDTIRAAYRNLAFGEKNQLGIPGLIAWLFLLPLSKTRSFKTMIRKSAAKVRPMLVTYNKAGIDLSMNSILDLPEVVVVQTRVKTVNVLVPAFSIETMSAGFFGVFQIALMIARQGLNVRLVLFDNFYFDRDVFHRNLQRYPGLERLLDEVELDYVGDRYLPLNVSPHDSAVATVWYSAYFARKIMDTIGGGPFLYLIQDYEAAFYPFSSLYALADATYAFNYQALVSTKPLLEFMKAKSPRVAALASANKAVYFNNACSAAMPEKADFLAKHAGKTKKLAFYSRPTVNRNMFDLGARALIDAWNKGYFDTGHNWELYGMGIGDVEIHLDARRKITQLPRMSLGEYEEKIREFDICLSLMASPHPSITPFDMAGVGAIVVTNAFENKAADYFAGISPNILVSAPDVPSLTETLRLALSRVDDLDGRFDGAVNMNYPRDWESVWTDEHRALVRVLFGSAPGKASPLSGGNLVERHTFIHPNVGRQAKHPFGDDIP
ncbi:MAG TPA: hypothetical protein DDZ81_02515 [Acetobacteraceae bacterium]|nr:hypothetical protein [Acetobacteraceae bacterium]